MQNFDQLKLSKRIRGQLATRSIKAGGTPALPDRRHTKKRHHPKRGCRSYHSNPILILLEGLHARFSAAVEHAIYPTFVVDHDF